MADTRREDQGVDNSVALVVVTIMPNRLWADV